MPKIIVRQAKERDFIAVHNFVCGCDMLESYPIHIFKIILRYFGNTCFIAEKGEKIEGVATGFFSQKEKNKYFLWQIGVSGDVRGKGIAKLLIKEAEKNLKQAGCRTIEATVDPQNIPARKLFESSGYLNTSEKSKYTVKIDGTPSIKDFYGPGRHFLIFQKNIAKKEK